MKLDPREIEKLCIKFNESEESEFINVNSKILKIEENSSSSTSSEPIKKLMNIKNRINLLKDLSEVEIKQVIKNVKFTKFQKDEIIIKEGENSAEIFFTLLGELKVLVGGRQVGFIRASQAFGELAAIRRQPRNATIKASTNVVALSFEVDFKAKETNPKIFNALFLNVIDELIKKLENKN